MKKVSEEKLLEKVVEFYRSPMKGALVIPTDHTGKLRWYITKITSSMSEFLLDQPLLRKKMEESGESISNVRDMIDSSDKKEREIGSILLFLPKSDTSFDPVLSNFCIVPHPVKDIDELPKIFEEVLKNNIGKHLYIGPFHYNDDTEEYQCCYYEISEEELWKDIEKFRENNNTYFTYFDELDYTIY